MDQNSSEDYRRAVLDECPDVNNAALCARNCLLYEADRGPAELQVGYLGASLLIPR